MKPLLYARNAIQHFYTIIKHKLIVMDPCFRVGLIHQGLVHNLSEYSPTEFIVGICYFQDVRSLGATEHWELGYSRSWLYHKGRNRHRYGYQMDVDKKRDWINLKMPPHFALEMVCGRIAVSKVYSGQGCTDAAPLGYYLSKQEGRLLHPEIRTLLKKLLYTLRSKEKHYTLGYIRWLRRHPTFYEYREQPTYQ